MNVAELRSLMPVSAPVLIADSSYSKPTSEWLTGKFWKWFIAWRHEMGLTRWTRNNDCDNFARAYAQAAQDLHALSLDPNEREGLAVGEFWYHAPAGPHAIVVAVTELGVTFIEPQNNQRLVLTQKEFNSCFFARF